MNHYAHITLNADDFPEGDAAPANALRANFEGAMIDVLANPESAEPLARYHKMLNEMAALGVLPTDARSTCPTGGI